MNIDVGNYETRNFDIFPLASAAFGEFSSDDKNTCVAVENAAKFVDAALGIIKKAHATGSLSTQYLDDLIADIDKAEELLDEAGELENHEYLRDHLEPMAIEMYDLSDIDGEDEASSYDDEEEWLYGDSDL